jgi:hypothetical protein
MVVKEGWLLEREELVVKEGWLLEREEHHTITV